MSKKHNKREKLPRGPVAPPKEPILSARGKRVAIAGAAAAATGFAVLYMADPAGQNLAAKIAPFLIIGGYAAFGAGIILEDPAPPPSDNAPDKIGERRDNPSAHPK